MGKNQIDPGGENEDQIVVGAIQTEILEVSIHVNLQKGYIIQVMALVDTWSSVSFLVKEYQARWYLWGSVDCSW